MSAGVEKLEESITKPLDKISDEIEKNRITKTNHSKLFRVFGT